MIRGLWNLNVVAGRVKKSGLTRSHFSTAVPLVRIEVWDDIFSQLFGDEVWDDDLWHLTGGPVW